MTIWSGAYGLHVCARRGEPHVTLSSHPRRRSVWFRPADTVSVILLDADPAWWTAICVRNSEQWPRIDTSHSVINGRVCTQMRCCHMQIWTSLDEAMHTQKKLFCPAAFASHSVTRPTPTRRTMQTYELYSVAFKSSGWHVCNSAVVCCWFCEQNPEILIFYLHLIWNMGCDKISLVDQKWCNKSC